MSLWLVGAGTMAQAYARVLTRLGRPFTVIGRGEASAKAFEDAVGVPVLRERPAGRPDLAIVAVGVKDLAAAVRATRAKRTLVEKPAGLSMRDFAGLKNAFVAYNRRHYASTRKARELIAEDGGALSFHFEFTELGRKVGESRHPPEVKAKWLAANSSHVLDLAFHLGGEPAAISAYKSGRLPWHPSGSVYAGAGRAKGGALFSYHANWESAGRWGVEVMTRRRRLVLRPLEKLFVQEHGSFDLVPVPLDDALDRDFKPGLYRQVEAFLAGSKELLSVAEHARRLRAWRRIGVEL